MSKNDYKTFAQAEIGDVFTRPVLLGTVTEAADKFGKPFVKLSLKDGFSEITPCMFKISKGALEENGVHENMLADVELSVSRYNGVKNFTVERIAPSTDHTVSISDFIKMPPIDIDKMYDEICELLKSCANDCGGRYTPLSNLALQILEDKKDRYKFSSAAISMHHNMRGGLLYHSYRMVKAVDALCGVYGTLDRELLLCGAALHDIGKIWEYKTSDMGDAEFTSNGVLFGHLYLGASLIKKYTEGENYSTERVQLLTHMILSHHGTREFGAVVCPATAEAFVLYYVDNIDAKLYACEDYYKAIEPGAITDKKPFGLDNRIYRPMMWSAPTDE